MGEINANWNSGRRCKRHGPGRGKRRIRDPLNGCRLGRQLLRGSAHTVHRQENVARTLLLLLTLFGGWTKYCTSLDGLVL